MAQVQRIQDTLYGILDSNTGESFTYSKVTAYSDGSAMSNAKCDGVIYRKLGSEYFKRNFTGAVDVSWFGAVGDGFANDTAAFQKAVASGFDIRVPKGIYNISNIALQDRQKVFSDSTLAEIRPVTAGDACFILSNTYNVISGLSFFWNSKAGCSAIKVNGASRFLLSNLRIVGYFEYGAELITPLYSTIKNCHFAGNRFGIRSSGGGTFLNIAECSFLNIVDFYIDLLDMPSVLIDRCHLGAADSAQELATGIRYVSTGAFPGTFLVVSHCDIDSIKGDGIIVEGDLGSNKLFDVKITNNFISTGREGTGNGIVIKKSFNVFISGNEVLNTGGCSVRVIESGQVSITNNDLQYCEESAILIDNSHGVRVLSNSIGSIVGEPFPGAAPEYGVREINGSNDNIITGNDIQECVTLLSITGAGSSEYGNKLKIGGQDIIKNLSGKLALQDGFEAGSIQGGDGGNDVVKFRSRGKYRTGTAGRQSLLNAFFATDGNTGNAFTDTAGESAKNWFYGIVSDIAFFSIPRFSLINSGKELFSFFQDGTMKLGIQRLSTANRPSNPDTGRTIIDLTLNKIIHYDGTNWRDAMGAIVGGND
jgi:hypothetical protein